MDRKLNEFLKEKTRTSLTPEQQKSLQMNRFMRITSLEEEKSQKNAKISEKISSFKKQAESLLKRLEENEAKASEQRQRKEKLIYEMTQNAKLFFIKLHFLADYEKIFKIFLSAEIPLSELENLLPGFLDTQDFAFFLECSKLALKKEKLLKEKNGSFHKYSRNSSIKLLSSVEKKCGFIRRSLHLQNGKASFIRGPEVTESSFDSDFAQNEVVRDLELKIYEIERKIEDLKKKHKEFIEDKLAHSHNKLEKQFLSEKVKKFFKI